MPSLSQYLVDTLSGAIIVPFAARNALLACVFVCVFMLAVIVCRFQRFFSLALCVLSLARQEVFHHFYLGENFIPTYTTCKNFPKT